MSKNITKKTIENFMKNNKPEDVFKCVIGEGDDSFVIEIKTSLTVVDKGNFVNRVVNACFDVEENYLPEYRTPVFNVTLLQMLTNIQPYVEEVHEFDEDGNETGNVIEVIDIDKTYALARALGLDNEYRSDNRRLGYLVGDLGTLVDEKISYRERLNLSAERALLQKAREDLETGIALVNSIGTQLNDTMKSLDFAKIGELDSAEYKAILDRVGNI